MVTLDTPIEEAHPLYYVFFDAMSQAQFGKGEARHGYGKPFEDQPITKITALFGPRGPAFQVAKKTHEAIECLENGTFTQDQAYEEILGAIVYLAAIALHIKGDDHETVG